MQATTQTRLQLLSDDEAQLLDLLAELYGSMKRKLYARIAGGGNAQPHKTAFCRRHGISARMFNALAIELQGLMDLTRELLKEECKGLRRVIRSLERQLATRGAQLEEVAANRLRLKRASKAKLRRRTHQNARRLEKLTSKHAKVGHRLHANAPGICFGTRKLFRQQHHLELAGFNGYETWLRQWQVRDGSLEDPRR
jgi:hypothetical protein